MPAVSAGKYMKNRLTLLWRGPKGKDYHKSDTSFYSASSRAACTEIYAKNPKNFLKWFSRLFNRRRFSGRRQELFIRELTGGAFYAGKQTTVFNGVGTRKTSGTPLKRALICLTAFSDAHRRNGAVYTRRADFGQKRRIQRRFPANGPGLRMLCLPKLYPRVYKAPV